MSLLFEKDRVPSSIDAAFMDRLKQIHAAMDSAYHRAAEHYGFFCDGCRDICCRTRFYHHTIIEYAYLIEGFKTLNPAKQNEVKSRAVAVVDETARADQSGAGVRLMCPLNFDDLCILYPYRPMICRLHGIPNTLRRPDGRILTGPGCDDYYLQCGSADGAPLDRTPLYAAMADIERRLRDRLGFNSKIKLTVARMILEDSVAL